LAIAGANATEKKHAGAGRTLFASRIQPHGGQDDCPLSREAPLLDQIPAYLKIRLFVTHPIR
jgi:hypothetical protein